MNSPTFGIGTRVCLGVRKAIRVLGTTLVVLLVSVPLFSQNLGRISGSVTDQSGGAIAGATVTVTDVGKGVSRALTTNEAGEYAAPDLTPGTKTVRAEFKGFKSVERQDLLLEVGRDLRIDFVLQPGTVTETVTVTEAAPLIETTNAELGGTLSNQTINDLPLNGRNFENLLVLRPGVTIYPGGGGWTQSTNGLRAHDNVYMVDGVVNNEPWTGQSVMNAAMAAGDAGTMLPIDAIDEFKTEQNPRAEFGWKPGSIVNVGIKSGTNSMHGTAYAYGRTDAWDAHNYFTPHAGNPACQTNAELCNPPVSLEQYGATFGGAIRKDKLFYFLSYEDQRYSIGTPSVHSGPITGGANAADPANADALRGACLAVPAASRAALSLQLAGLDATCASLSNYPGIFPVNGGPTASFGTALNSTNQIDAGLVKIDYHINERHVLNGMYFISPGSGVQVDAPPAEVAAPWLTNQSARAQTVSGSWTWTPNPRWVNEVRVGYAHYYQSFLSNDSSEDPANYKFNGTTYHLYTGQTNAAYFGLPQIQFSSYGGSLQFGQIWPKTLGPDGVFQFLDHVSTLRGKHAFKFGGEVLLNRSTSNVTANAKGPIRFADLQSFFNGIPNRAKFLSGNVLRHLSSESYAGFAQDDWRVTPRVTVNLGLRYELNTVMKESNNLIGNFDPTAGLVQVGKQISSPYNGDHNNFAPRFGLAWDVRGNGKTVVRAGGGIMYEQLSYDMFNAIGNLLGLRMVPTGVALYMNNAKLASPGNIAVASTTFTGPAVKGTTVPGQIAFNWINNGPNQPLYSNSPACGDGTFTLPTGFAPGPCDIAGVARNLRTPYVSTWTLDVQHAVTTNLSLEVGYVGNRGTKLIGTTDINQGAPGGGPRPFSVKFPYLNFIDFLSNRDTSSYNALQVTATQRTSHGLSFTLGYTYSHALDDNSDNWGASHQIPIINSNPGLLYGNSDFDIRHRFTWSTTYALPGKKGFGQSLEGWSINSVLTLETGQPWTVQDTSNDFSGTGEVGQTGGPPNNWGHGEQWDFFGNPADFTTKHGLCCTTNGGSGGVPFFNGSNPTAGPNGFPAACNAHAALADLKTTGCFALGNSVMVPPAAGTFGTMGRNIFRDGGLKNWDLSVTKAWKFKEKLTAQFRAEFFNFFNHPNFTNPYGGPNGFAANDPSAGPGFGCGCATPDVAGSNPVLGTGGNRAIQLGLKLRF